MRLPIVLLSPLCLISLAAAQTTYYVDAVNGNDSNLGTTRAAAFQSISWAVTLMVSDDTLLVLPGTYSPTNTAESFPIRLGHDGSNPRFQPRIKIIGESGPSQTIIDGEGQMADSLTPIMRCYFDASGAEITGLSFQNTGNDDYWSMCVRIGSTSGGAFATEDIEIHGCEFTNCARALVIFGTTTPNLPNQTTRTRFHDNLINQNLAGSSRRAIAVWGDGTNYIYNNTIVNPTHDGIYVDALVPEPTSQAVIANNVIVGGATSGITAGDYTGGRPGGTTAVYENNNAFGNNTDYAGHTFPPSNTNVDPLFVGAADFHLQATSPMIEAGNNGLSLFLRHDYDGFSRAHDADRNASADVDKGCFEFNTFGMNVTGTWMPGGSLSWTFTGQPGTASLLFGLNRGAFVVQPFGVVLVDLANGFITDAFVGTVPGTITINVPANNALLGAPLASQGLRLDVGGTLHMENGDFNIF